MISGFQYHKLAALRRIVELNQYWNNFPEAEKQLVGTKLSELSEAEVPLRERRHQVFTEGKEKSFFFSLL